MPKSAANGQRFRAENRPEPAQKKRAKKPDHKKPEAKTS